MSTTADSVHTGGHANTPAPPEPGTGSVPQKRRQQKTKQQHRRPSAGRASAGGVEGGASHKSTRPPKKRRKVNHACIYCRRSHMTCDLERPCTRCIKRNIGHLCHDEPREPGNRPNPEPPSVQQDGDATTPVVPATALVGAPEQPPRTHAISTVAQHPIVQAALASAPHASNLAANAQSSVAYNDWSFGGPNNLFQDMHVFHPSCMFNASEVSNEYNLLNDLLSSGFMDDGALYGGDGLGSLFSDQSFTDPLNIYAGRDPPTSTQPQTAQPPSSSHANLGNAISRPTSAFPLDKAREAYYMTAADPAGNDTAEERMNKLLKAKFDAGMLKPFNYIKGYARLYQYIERNFKSASRQQIQRCMDRFRPKFRERVQTLTDMELVHVEMWFERRLMEYDRVFASMAIPACCWRRTGEIFRGNKEMAELVNVPIEDLRDGKLSLHDIFDERSLVSYWHKFGAIAFDRSQKAMLTSCLLKSPDSGSKDPEIRCCFSFTIRRDAHNIPALIIGDFLPIITDDGPRLSS